MKLSIVASLYRSAEYIDEFHQRCSDAARKVADEDYELILVNDGSPDNSLEIAIALTEVDPHVKLIDLSRNFGHHKAMMTGLAHACGDQVFLIDSDLEEEPEWLTTFVDQMRKERSDVVYGVQKSRKGGAFEKLSGYLYYKVFRSLTGISQPNNIVTARLMTRRYVQALVDHKERELNIGGLWITTGYRQSQMPINKHHASPTTYSISHKLGHLINAITSFSNKPLVYIFYTGLLISTSAMLFIIKLVFQYFFIATPPSGYTSIAASIWLFSGLIIFFLGVQGIYIAKIFTEVKQRPYTIVRAIHRHPSRSSPDLEKAI